MKIESLEIEGTTWLKKSDILELLSKMTDLYWAKKDASSWPYIMAVNKVINAVVTEEDGLNSKDEEL